MEKEVMFVGKKTFHSNEKNKDYYVVSAGFDGDVVDFFVEKKVYDSIALTEYTKSMMKFELKVFNRRPQLNVVGLSKLVA